jgi:predicted anti-sigma-YlaC factor YlaD
MSLALDDELSAVGEAFLEAHLDQCADCRSFRAGLEELTGALRGAPLLAPPTAVAVSHRRLRGRAGLATAALSSATAAATIAALLSGLNPHASFTPPQASAIRLLHQQLTLKQQQLSQLDEVVKTEIPLRATPGAGPDPTTGA